MKITRDLILLSALAFQNKKFDSAGQLFAAALSSADSPEFLDFLRQARTTDENNHSESSDDFDDDKHSISKIAKELAASMSGSETRDEEDDLFEGEDDLTLDRDDVDRGFKKSLVLEQACPSSIGISKSVTSPIKMKG